MNARTVLLVADEPLIRLATADVLTESGCIVLEAESSGEALAWIDAHSEIDVIVADVHVPGELNGVEVSEIAWRTRPGLRVIVTSGSGLPDSARMPPNGLFLPKPFRAHQLRAAVIG